LKSVSIGRLLFTVILAVNACEMSAAVWKKKSPDDSRAKYLARVQSGQVAPPALSPGSIWVDSGPLASLSADYKARIVGDVITITVAQGLTSSNTGAVSAARTFNTSSGVDSLPFVKSSVAQTLLGLHSADTLAGKSQAASATTVSTTLAGRVVAVLASGNLVVEAERVIDMNHEKQTIVLRGIVRPGDIGPGNMIASNSVSDLELEIKGKGVISNGVRPVHPWLSTVLRIFNF
jgi:flagellar L-ring protein precursor FlgH